jgi:predicted DNA-binding transcriptional regulator YafY
MRLHRLISILLTIENRGKITAKELAAQFETSTRTIYRDIESLCEAGIPIVAETGPHGGLSLVEGYQTGLKQLGKDELVYLFLNGMGVQPERGSAIALGVNASLLKLQKLLARDEAAEVKTRISRFYVDPSPWWGQRSPLKHMDALMKAIWDSQKVAIHYRKMDQTVSIRTLRPYGIVVKDTDWYLVAYCEDSHGLRTFKCERIAECALLPDHFNLPDDFSVESYFKTSLQAFRSDRQAAEQYPVTLRIAQKDAYLLRPYENFSTRICEGEVEVVLNMYSFENALNDFWNVLIKSRVMEPVELREAVRECLRGQIGQYS